jgi:hypothetical protein
MLYRKRIFPSRDMRPRVGEIPYSSTCDAIEKLSDATVSSLPGEDPKEDPITPNLPRFNRSHDWPLIHVRGFPPRAAGMPTSSQSTDRPHFREPVGLQKAQESRILYFLPGSLSKNINYKTPVLLSYKKLLTLKSVDCSPRWPGMFGMASHFTSLNMRRRI